MAGSQSGKLEPDLQSLSGNLGIYLRTLELDFGIVSGNLGTSLENLQKMAWESYLQT